MSELEEIDIVEFTRLLKNKNPALFTVEAFNRKFLKDMEFGEIHIIEFVKNGKIIRVEVTPTYSKKTNELDNVL
jgi:hypothetical protein